MIRVKTATNFLRIAMGKLLDHFGSDDSLESKKKLTCVNELMISSVYSCLYNATNRPNSLWKKMSAKNNFLKD